MKSGNYGIQQADGFACPVHGAAAGSLADCSALAAHAWGEPCRDGNSGLIAFGYLWRRFGPPWAGTDSYKKLVSYILTTPEPDVWLEMMLSGNALPLCVGYIVDLSIERELHAVWDAWECRLYDWVGQQHPDVADSSEDFWRRVDQYRKNLPAEAIAAIGQAPGRTPDPRDWQTCGGPISRVCTALVVAMRELLRPVYVRDIPINVLGRCGDCSEPASRSPYAGFGVPKNAMDERIAS
uniref:Uncharacterized protein n=1 Tax=viral metagenome TaxID=1070528 RepID=A0A6M3LRN7_9ZZZZ